MGRVMLSMKCSYPGRSSYQSLLVRTCQLIIAMLMLTWPASVTAANLPVRTLNANAILPNTSSPTPNILRLIDSFPRGWLSTGKNNALPNLYVFIAQVTNHEAGIVRGVYVPEMFALPVIQQPTGNYSYVSPARDRVTQFRSAMHFNVIGLLAHNYLSGNLFQQLALGQLVIIVMGDGSTRGYVISASNSFQRLQNPARSDEFIDLNSGESYSTVQIFNRFYRGGHHLTFQTCLEKDGDQDWGVYFVVARPVRSVHSGHPARTHITPR
jgi:hypothetical protein